MTEQAQSTTVWTTLEPVNCAQCDTLFGLSARHIVELKRTHASFMCPNGHGNHWPGESDIERANKRAEFWQDRARQQENETRAERHKASVARGQVTRIQNRIHAGVCPDCHRTFKNVARHMASKHGAKP